MIGVGTAFLLDYLDDTVHTPEDAREALGVNVLGSVPDVGEDKAIGWLAQAQPLSPAAEAFRNLRTSLQYLSLDAPITTLAVTSTQPDEGKSFIISNLATTFALAGNKVLLLECDLRRASLHRLFDVDRTPGVTETLKALSETQVGAADAEIEAAMQYVKPTEVEGLYLLTGGAHVGTPAELLSSQTFRRLIEVLAREFDLLVLDAPPVLAVADAAILAAQVDAMVMVTVSGQTRLPSAARAIERIRSVGGNLLGLVINRLTARSGGYYYTYYQYDHRYTYGGEDHHNGNGRVPKARENRCPHRSSPCVSRSSCSGGMQSRRNIRPSIHPDMPS